MEDIIFEAQPMDTEQEEREEETLQEILDSFQVSNNTLKKFALYSYFVYYRLTQTQLSGLVALLNSPIFGHNIQLNVQKMFTKVQSDLQGENVILLALFISFFVQIIPDIPYNLFSIKGQSIPVFDIQSIIREVINGEDFFEDILTQSTFDGENFNNITSGYLFHSHFRDCAEKGIIPVHAHLFFDDVPITKNTSAGPLYIHFLNTKSRFNRDTYYLLSYSSHSTVGITDVLPFALRDIEVLNNMGKLRKIFTHSLISSRLFFITIKK